MIRQLLFPLLCLTILSVPLTAVPWNKAQLTHGRIALDGGLDASLPLGRLRGSPEFAFPIRLEHTLSAYPLGEHAGAVEATSCRFPNAPAMLENFLLTRAPVYANPRSRRSETGGWDGSECTHAQGKRPGSRFYDTIGRLPVASAPVG